MAVRPPGRPAWRSSNPTRMSCFTTSAYSGAVKVDCTRLNDPNGARHIDGQQFAA
ncbi:hypothetical protein BZL30_9350 [Mycobacterium kansasii]|uniref:Uncharacterized protein n=1 Tax=Mycobacterium kansasii TaxID=1768 RepID=A0A1V3WAE9_MYCKA|nr:hypothetical protein BZL30_9350 [Mycobacterium kansasii]